MNVRSLFTAAATGALALSLVAAHEGVETNDFVLNGAQEASADTPSVTGDPTGEAVAHVRIPEDDGTAICLTLEITQPLVDPTVTGLHIHLGGRNETGGVAVDLTSLAADLNEDGVVDACIDNPVDGAGVAVPGARLADIVLDGRSPQPGRTNGHPSGFTADYYLNVHTEAFPAGAIRGQIKGQQYQSSQRPTPNG